MNYWKKLLSGAPTYLDAVIASMVIIFCVWQPFALHGPLNFFELSLYLPGIQSLLNGEIPYRDFAYLRGPLEVWIPTWLMVIFGKDVAVLSLFFTWGNILTLVVGILIAKEVMSSRLFLYGAGLVLAARTFPRIVYNYWGGLRYVFGLLVVWFLLLAWKHRKPVLLIPAGIFSAAAIFTSFDVGLATVVTSGIFLVGVYFVDRKLVDVQEYLKHFCYGFFGLAMPVVLYLLVNDAWMPFLEMSVGIMTNMTATFPQTEIVPQNIFEVVWAMINPTHKNFRHMTPLYTYLFMVGFLYWRTKGKFYNSERFIPWLIVWSYGGLLFIAAFRNLWASQYEMALQPAKLILLMLVEAICLTGINYFILERKLHLKWRWVMHVFIAAIILSSTIYPLSRMIRKYSLFAGIKSELKTGDFNKASRLNIDDARKVNVPILKNHLLPNRQADNISGLYAFFKDIPIEENVIVFPEHGIFEFILERRGPTRFPLYTNTWFVEQWHDEYLKELNQNPPEYVIINREIPEYFADSHFTVEKNLRMFETMRGWIFNRYQSVFTTTDYLGFKKAVLV